jgi:hypothetical protein
MWFAPLGRVAFAFTVAMTLIGVLTRKIKTIIPVCKVKYVVARRSGSGLHEEARKRAVGRMPWAL